MVEKSILQFRGITKRFPGVVALRDVSFDIAAGSCHGLVGENGAGKSTLGKILAGIELPDGGEILVAGQAVRFAQPRDALAAGIGMVHQELAFCENLSVAENLCLGQLPSRGLFVSRRELKCLALKALATIEAAVDPDRCLGELPISQQQLVQIAAAVSRGARILIFDEPTSSLSRGESEHLFALIQRLKAQGITSIYVSHRLEEIFQLCDAVTVLRDGQVVATQPTSELNEDKLVQMMIGRTLDAYYPKHLQSHRGDELLRVENLTSTGKFKDISFSLHAGEVLGLAGLVGSGRTELAEAIFGLDSNVQGKIFISESGRGPEGGKGQESGRGPPRRASLSAPTSLPELLVGALRPLPHSISSPAAAMHLGLGLIPEDRKRHGLVLPMNARENVSLPILPSLARLGWVQRREERAMAAKFFERMRVRASGVEASVATLSGGNQQKVVLAKWLAARCQILLLDEPARGVDVGAKAEIHGLIDQMANEGKAVLLISSDLPEVLALSTRILVLRRGRLVGEVPREKASQEALMRMMAGITN